MSIYRLMVLIHVLSALTFVMAHGVSMMMMFKVQRERKAENLCNYLEISSAALGPAMLALRGIEISGIILTIMGGWWRMGWIWVSLGLFLVVGVVMVRYAASYMNRVRKAMGMPNARDLKKGLRPLPAPQEVLLEVVASGQPKLVASLGLSGMAIIVALMVMKPF